MGIIVFLFSSKMAQWFVIPGSISPKQIHKSTRVFFMQMACRTCCSGSDTDIEESAGGKALLAMAGPGGGDQG